MCEGWGRGVCMYVSGCEGSGGCEGGKRGV